MESGDILWPFDRAVNGNVAGLSPLVQRSFVPLSDWFVNKGPVMNGLLCANLLNISHSFGLLSSEYHGNSSRFEHKIGGLHYNGPAV